MPRIDFSTLAILLTLFALGVNSITAFNNITKEGQNLRRVVLLTSFFTVLSVIALVTTVQPVEYGLLYAGILVTAISFFLFVVTRQYYQDKLRKDKNYSSVIETLLVAENELMNYLLSELVNATQNLRPRFPALDESIAVLLGSLEKLLSKTSTGMEFSISILRVTHDFRLRVVARTQNNISPQLADLMNSNFSWREERPLGVAGKCAATNRNILCTDLNDEAARRDCCWIELQNGRTPKGGILCMVIPYPDNYHHQGAPMKCFGVVSISCSTANHLSRNHEILIEKTFINVFKNFMLIHELSDLVL